MNLSQIIEVLLFSDNDDIKLRDAAHDYYKLLSDLTGISDESSVEGDKTETILETGKAISPVDAARCVLDFVRTSKFLRGIYAAINEAKIRFPSEKIEILYAGCGPFAALAVPFCFKFQPDEISFTLIDIHKRSLESAECIFQKLGFENFISEYIQNDASTFRAENGKNFHIIITETMQKALEKEPQAAIILNLAASLLEDGIFIPQTIIIDAFLTDFQKEFSSAAPNFFLQERIYLGNIFELSAENSPDKNSLSALRKIKLPLEIKNSNCLILSTRIQIFNNFVLDEYDSGLTYPAILREFSETSAGTIIEIQYKFGNDPHFECRAE